MSKVKIDSSVIKEIEIGSVNDPNGNKRIVISFNTGRDYEYNLPSTVVEEFVKAPSAGTFFARQIRPNYQGKLI